MVFETSNCPPGGLPAYLDAIQVRAQNCNNTTICHAVGKAPVTCDLPEMSEYSDNHVPEIAGGIVIESCPQECDLVSPAIHALHSVFEACSRLDSRDATQRAKTILKIMLDNDVLHQLLSILADLDIQSQKQVVEVFAHVALQAKCLDSLEQFQQHIIKHPSLFDVILKGCNEQSISMHSALILRALISHAKLLSHAWQIGVPLRLIELIHHDTEISAQACASLHSFLLSNKDVACDHLGSCFDEFFSSYHKLLDIGSANVRQEALSLLASILLDPAFISEMLRYITHPSFLRIHMRFLQDKSNEIRLDAFHIFKIFVGNTNKPDDVRQILAQSSEDLLTCLDKFAHSSDAEELAEDLSSLAGILLELPLMHV